MMLGRVLIYIKIDVLHAKPQTFQQAKSRSIKQVAGNPVLSIQLAQYLHCVGAQQLRLCQSMKDPTVIQAVADE